MGGDDQSGVGFVARIDRNSRLRAFFLRRLLRAHRYDFASYGRIAAIVGDDIGDQIRVSGRYEDEHLNAIEKLVLPHVAPASDCIDVGANIGNHSLFFSRHFKRVVAFEPNPVARALLDINLWMNGVRNVEVRAVGLSDAEGTEVLSVCLDNLGATRLRSFAEADPEFSHRVVEDVEVALTTGDSALDRDHPVGLIKIDVEGLEPQVLKGLAQTIGSHRPVIVLEQLASAIDAASGGSEVSDIMRKHGYRAFEIRRIARTRVKLLNDLLTYVSGTLHYALVPVARFESRQYSALIYLTDEIVERIARIGYMPGAGIPSPANSSGSCQTGEQD